MGYFLEKEILQMTTEQAKAELERIMESGDRAELEKFIERSYEDNELLIAIMDVLIPDAE